MDREQISWQGWMERKWWPFFRAFYLHYRPDHRIPFSEIWHRRETPAIADGRPIPCTIRRLNALTVALDFDTSGFGDESWTAEMNVNYETAGPHKLVVGIDETGTALDAQLAPNGSMREIAAPRDQHLVWPLQFIGGQPASMRLTGYGRGAEGLTITACTAAAFLPTREMRFLRPTGQHITLTDYEPNTGPHVTGFIIDHPAEILDMQLGSVAHIAGHTYNVISIDMPGFALNAQVPDAVLQNHPPIEIDVAKDMAPSRALAHQMQDEADRALGMLP